VGEEGELTELRQEFDERRDCSDVAEAGGGAVESIERVGGG
jgi:hypothetical protein